MVARINSDDWRRAGTYKVLSYLLTKHCVLRTTHYLLGHREDATDDGTELCEEGGEGLALLLHHDLVRGRGRGLGWG